ncbi:MAG: branched-chain amino acid ABC transporter permease [Atribacterota bacterium]|jgi:branched-chain amino acid transport system permease protein|nr:branched-chain amino acid ABC transporter permease [Atribacterota bacterium]MDD4895456.1 branched-chain amino acid ABC transporter permease [Atribacterota bacterium]MDD5637633.1 branched-chain amino acid ABC transporter permease [Atribacterota bacterium]
MEVMIQSIFNGILMGCIYALIALGLSLIFGVMNVVNFAHGNFVMLSMYFTFWAGTLYKIDAVLSSLITFPLLFLFGILVYYGLISRTLREHYTIQIAVTVGLMTFLGAITQLIWQARPRALAYSFVQGTIQFGSYTIALSRLISAIISLIIIMIISFFLARTWPGRAIRATSDDSSAASLMGIDFQKTYALAFGLGSGLTAIAGSLLMTFQQVDPTMGLRFGLLSFCILALAGLGSITGLVISGLIVGISESLAMSFWDPRARTLVIYLIFILVLWLRPRGLFGRK